MAVRRIALFGVALSVALASGIQAQGFATRDSAGVRIAESADGLWSAGQEWTRSALPLVTVGGVEAPEGADLWRVGGFERLANGGVVVLSSGHSQVRVYGPSGELVRSIGRAGNGPGEFMLMPPTGALSVVAPDTLVVLDADGLDRVLMDGSIVDSRRLDRSPGALGPGSQLVPFGFGPGGSLYAVVHRRSQVPTSGVFRPDQGYAVIPQDPATDPRLLGWYGGLAQQLVSAGSGSTPVITPFARMTTHSIGRSEGAPLYVADTDRQEVHVYAGDGRLRSIVRWTRDRARVRDEWVESWKETQRENDWVQARLPVYERAWAEMSVPTLLPSLDAVAGDTEGALWVLRPSLPGDGQRTYDVFDATGRLLGPVAVPPGLVHSIAASPRIGPDYFMAVWQDSFGVESVRVYGLSRDN